MTTRTLGRSLYHAISQGAPLEVRRRAYVLVRSRCLYRLVESRSWRLPLLGPTCEQCRSLRQTATTEDIEVSSFLAFQAASKGVPHFEGQASKDIMDDLFRVNASDSRQSYLALMVSMVVARYVVVEVTECAMSFGNAHSEPVAKEPGPSESARP